MSQSSSTESVASSPSPPMDATPIASSASARSEADLWQHRAQNAERELVVRQALGAVDWFDVDDAYRALAPQAIQRKDEKAERSEWFVESKTQGDSEARYLPLSEAVKELAAQKSHWVRARVRSGSGAGSGTTGGSTRSLSYGDLLKAENHEKLREYIHQRPDVLERLRQSHFKR